MNPLIPFSQTPTQPMRTATTLARAVCRLSGLLLVILILSMMPPVRAQEMIRVNDVILTSITPQNPVAEYQFFASSDTTVTLSVQAITPDLIPILVIAAPDNTTVATNTNTGGATEIEVSPFIIQDGSHRVLVLGGGDSFGEIVLRMTENRALPDPLSLEIDTSVADVMSSENRTQRYAFSALPDAFLQLRVESGSTNHLPEVTIEDAGDGTTIASLQPALFSGTVMLAPGTGDYLARIEYSGDNSEEAYTLTLSSRGLAGEDTITCFVTPQAGRNVNIRSGPGTGFRVIGTLPASETTLATGRSGSGDWWQTNLNGIEGWMASFVIEVSGECDDLPVVAGSIRTEPHTPTPSP